jgi:hypothetical protein
VTTASTYILTTTDTNGCTATASRQVVVHPRAPLSIRATSVKSAGGTLSDTAVVANVTYLYRVYVFLNPGKRVWLDATTTERGNHATRDKTVDQHCRSKGEASKMDEHFSKESRGRALRLSAGSADRLFMKSAAMRTYGTR